MSQVRAKVVLMPKPNGERTAIRHRESLPSRSALLFSNSKQIVARRQSVGCYTASMSLHHGANADLHSTSSFGGKLAVTSKFGATPLMVAAWNGDTWEMKKLLEEEGVYMDAMDTIGRTALMLAAGEGRLAAVELLLESGADVFRTDDFGESALSIAAREGHADTCELLLKHNADIDEPDQFGQTPLIKASQAGHEDVVQLLLERGAKHSLVDVHQETALMKAVKRGHPVVVRLLGDFGATGGVRGKATKPTQPQTASQNVTPLRRRRTESSSTPSQNTQRAVTDVGKGVPTHMGRSRAPSCDRLTSQTLQQLMADKARFEAQLQMRQEQIAQRECTMAPQTPPPLPLTPGRLNQSKMAASTSVGELRPSEPSVSRSAMLRPMASMPVGPLQTQSLLGSLAALSLDDGEAERATDGRSAAKRSSMECAQPMPTQLEAVCQCPANGGGDSERGPVAKGSESRNMDRFERFLSSLECPMADCGNEIAAMEERGGGSLESAPPSPCTLDWLDEATTLPCGAAAATGSGGTVRAGPMSETAPPSSLSGPSTGSMPTFGRWRGGSRSDADLMAHDKDHRDRLPPRWAMDAHGTLGEEMTRLRDLLAHVANDRKELHREREALQRERETLQRERQAIDILQRRLSLWPWVGHAMPTALPLHLPVVFPPRQPPPDYSETCYMGTDNHKGGDVN